MIFRAPRFLFATAALVCSTAPAVASPAAGPVQPSACRKPEYPSESLAYAEEGVTSIAFLVNPDGTAKRWIIRNSSGSAALDRATGKALSKCLFTAATDGGKAVESWIPVEYRWSLDDSETSDAKHDAEVAAAKGDLAARYQLSVLLRWTAKTEADRQKSDAELRGVADLGYAPAQFALGRRYESGNRVKADVEEALRWYEKAAAQGDVLAIQRLRLGAVPD